MPNAKIKPKSKESRIKENSGKIWIAPSFLILSGLILLLASSWSWAAPRPTVQTHRNHTAVQITPDEAHARRVDQVALQSQDAAIARLNILIKKYRGRPQEPLLLMRLAHVYKESADIEFRVTFGTKGGKSKLTKYHARLRKGSDIITDLLRKFPSFQLADEALFIRAGAREELGQTAAAKQDYLRLTKFFPSSRFCLSSYMALANIAIEKNLHQEAISHLNQVYQDPASQHFPFALHKLAWSHFNLKNIDQALRYIVEHVQYFDQKSDLNSKQIGSTERSDPALREASLLDATLFYFEGYEENPSRYSVESALSYFKDLNPGETLGKMNTRFAKMLRSHRHEDALIQWKNIVLEKEPNIPDTVEIITIVLDHQWNRRLFSDFMKTLSDIPSLYQRHQHAKLHSGDLNEHYAETRKSLIEKAETLQKFLQKSQSSRSVRSYMKSLQGIYRTFISIIEDDDPRILQAKYNLAETSFRVRDYPLAARHYEWVLEHYKETSGLKVADLELKVISSHYETLRREKLIPENITPKKLDSSEWSEKKEDLPPALQAWIERIDEYSGPFNDTYGNFLFEANRSIYPHGVRASVERLTEYAKEHPNSKYTIPSEQLVLDSLIETKDWKETVKYTKRFIDHHSEATLFGKKLYQLAADASFKLIESKFESNDLESMIEEGRNFAQKYPKNPRVADILYLLAQASKKQNNIQAEQAYYSNLIQKYPNSKMSTDALLSRAQHEDAQDNWYKALSYYSQFLRIASNKKEEMNSDDLSKIKSRVRFLEWSMGRPLRTCQGVPLGDGNVESKECGQYVGYLAIYSTKHSAKERASFRQKAYHGPESTRALYSLAALRHQTSLSLRDRLIFIRSVAKRWENLEPHIRLSVLPAMNETLPKSLAFVRNEIQRVNPMNRPSPKAVQHRTEWIAELENTVAKMSELPWYRIQSEAMLELAIAYDDFVKNLKNSTVPNNLSAEEKIQYQKEVATILEPFIKKRDEIATRSLSIAHEAAIEDTARNSVILQFPTLAQSLNQVTQEKLKKALGNKNLQSFTQLQPVAIDLSFLDQFASSTLKDHILYQPLLSNLKSGNWNSSTAIIQTLQNQDKTSVLDKSLLSATLLAQSGSKAESLIEIQKALKELKGSQQKSLSKMLLIHYLRSGSVENSIELSQLSQSSKGGS